MLFSIVQFRASARFKSRMYNGCARPTFKRSTNKNTHSQMNRHNLPFIIIIFLVFFFLIILKTSSSSWHSPNYCICLFLSNFVKMTIAFDWISQAMPNQMAKLVFNCCIVAALFSSSSFCAVWCIDFKSLHTKSIGCFMRFYGLKLHNFIGSLFFLNSMGIEEWIKLKWTIPFIFIIRTPLSFFFFMVDATWIWANVKAFHQYKCYLSFVDDKNDEWK